MDWIYLPYAGLLALALFVELLLGNRQTTRAALAIVGVWVISTLYIYGHYRVTGELYHTPWYLFIGLDGIAAAVILMRPADRFAVILALSFVAQMVAHMAYGLTADFAPQDAYFSFLDLVAMAQIVWLIVWSGVNGYRNLAIGRHGGDRRLFRDTLADRFGRAQVAREERKS